MTDYLKCDLDDIVFEHRNQAYGSYALRKSYGNYMKKAALGGFSLFLLLVSSPLIADKMTPKRLNIDEGMVRMVAPPLENIKKPDVPKPLPPPPPPPKKIETIRFVPPVVTEKAETAPPIIVPPDPSVNIGTQNQEGEKTTAYVPPVEPPVALPPPSEAKEPIKMDEDKVILFVEQQPEFENGVKAMYQFLADNMKYPPIARENGIEGTVYVGFVVGKEGIIRDVVVKRGLGGGCSEEAARVVKLMPKWKPGKQQGRAVSVAYTIPVKFKLQ